MRYAARSSAALRRAASVPGWLLAGLVAFSVACAGGACPATEEGPPTGGSGGEPGNGGSGGDLQSCGPPYATYVPPHLMETDCANGLDDDDNGAADCRDLSCFWTVSCVESCGNGVDDNADGQVDCADPHCDTAPACAEDCGNGRDDDEDARVDCDDPFCALACGREDCTNGLDDDGDMLVDCQEFNHCAFAAGCAEDCGNGVDDNRDQRADCTDPLCELSAACAEDCTNGVDDDADGRGDCGDPYCSAHPACRECCTDGKDNDGDEYVDCQDADCYRSSDTVCPRPGDDRCTWECGHSWAYPLEETGEPCSCPYKECGYEDCSGGWALRCPSGTWRYYEWDGSDDPACP